VHAVDHGVEIFLFYSLTASAVAADVLFVNLRNLLPDSVRFEVVYYNITVLQ